MRVTSQPIAQATPDHLAVRLAQGAPALAAGVSVANVGAGSLSIAGVTATGSGVTASSARGGAVANVRRRIAGAGHLRRLSFRSPPTR